MSFLVLIISQGIAHAGYATRSRITPENLGFILEKGCVFEVETRRQDRGGYRFDVYLRFTEHFDYVKDGPDGPKADLEIRDAQGAKLIAEGELADQASSRAQDKELSQYDYIYGFYVRSEHLRNSFFRISFQRTKNVGNSAVNGLRRVVYFMHLTDFVEARGDGDSVGRERTTGEVLGREEPRYDIFPGCTFATGEMPWGLTMADFDGDGFEDVAMVNRRSNDISVLLGKEDGTFTEEARFSVGERHAAIATGDLNSDGVPDLMALNTDSDDISVLFGDGKGGFDEPRRIPVGENPHSLTIGDLNKDGSPDIVAVNKGSDDVSILLGNSDGTFQQQRRIAVGNKPQAVAVGDFNGDGRVDLAVANRTKRKILILWGGENGAFEAQRRFAIGAYAHSLVAADLNGDGLQDIAAAKERGDIAVLLGAEAGGFKDPAGYYVGEYLRSLVAQDVNEDGVMDLVTNGSVLLNQGDGRFQEPILFNGGKHASFARIVDFEDNGLVDLVTADVSSDSITVFQGNGDGSFRSWSEVPVFGSPQVIAAADFNGDGDTDLATANRKSEDVAVLLANDAKGFRPPQRFHIGKHATDLAVPGFNRDRYPDIAAVGDGRVLILWNRENGGFKSEERYVLPRLDPREWIHALATGDFDGDGMIDVVGSWDGELSVRLRKGERGFAEVRRYDMNATGPLETADFNQDGALDLVVGHLSRVAAVRLGRGDGTFPKSRRISVDGRGRVQDFAIGDFNRDGSLDFAAVCSDPGTIMGFLGKGDGTFRKRTEVAIRDGAISLISADLNGDEIVDLAAANIRSDDIAVFLGKGDGTFQMPRRFSVGRDPRDLIAAHLNGDDRLDLATANGRNNIVSILLNRSHCGNGCE